MSDAPASDRILRQGLTFDPADPSLAHGKRMFGQWLGRFDAALAASALKSTPEGLHLARPFLEQTAIGHRLYLAGARTPLFMLEGLARIEVGVRKDAEAFEKLLRHVKRLEDDLGEVDFWWVLATRGASWGLPAAIVRWAEAHHGHACGLVEGWLEASDWIVHPGQPEDCPLTLRTRKLSRLLDKASWDKPAKARKRLGRYLVERLHKTHEAATGLDLHDLEAGVHELRRKLRWFSIQAAALGGALTLDTAAEAPAGWDRYLVPSVVGSAFNKLPEAPEGVDPIALPAPLFYALSWLIAELGDIKDAAQWTEAVEAGLHVTGEAGTAADWLGDRALSHAEAGQRAAAAVQQCLLDDALLPRLAEAIEAQLG